MQFLVPLFWFAVAAGIYVYNQGEQGHIVMFGMEYLVGPDPDARGMATVALAVFIGAITGAGPLVSLFQKPEPEDED
ncbi:MAG: hypothetical protein EP330_27960 [Deltaproteobacteria bacterium]|nr:MAG: hypothetical protein EP330_27960 [Deltaproteobacteria bacterium]